MTEHKRNAQPQPPVVRLVLISLLAGMLGGGVIVGGYVWWNNYGSPTVSNSAGTTTTTSTTATSTAATKAFNSIKNAVVSVEAYSSSSSSMTTSESEGSGVIYKKKGNTAFIVTNNHVISGASKITIILYSGKKATATVVGKDSTTDLAVLKINAKDVKQVAQFGNSDKIQVGQTALAIGSPLGSTYATSLTQGIISAKKRTIDITNSSGVVTGQATVIQTDAAINPGNSGGPLINTAGQVIGINSMKLSSTSSSSSSSSGLYSSSSSTSVEGMGFAIPSNEVVKVINHLVKYGSYKRPTLGVSVLDLSYIASDSQSSVLKLPSKVTSGVVILKTTKNKSAAEAGLKKYDVIVKLGTKKVTSVATLKEALNAHKVGDTVKVQFYRNGKLQTKNVKLTSSSSD